MIHALGMPSYHNRHPYRLERCGKCLLFGRFFDIPNSFYNRRQVPNLFWVSINNLTVRAGNMFNIDNTGRGSSSINRGNEQISNKNKLILSPTVFRDVIGIMFEHNPVLPRKYKFSV